MGEAFNGDIDKQNTEIKQPSESEREILLEIQQMSQSALNSLAPMYVVDPSRSVRLGYNLRQLIKLNHTKDEYTSLEKKIYKDLDSLVVKLISRNVLVDNFRDDRPYLHIAKNAIITLNNTQAFTKISKNTDTEGLMRMPVVQADILSMIPNSNRIEIINKLRNRIPLSDVDIYHLKNHQRSRLHIAVKCMTVAPPYEFIPGTIKSIEKLNNLYGSLHGALDRLRTQRRNDSNISQEPLE